jgi:hypothetical protein
VTVSFSRRALLHGVITTTVEMKFKERIFKKQTDRQNT